MCCPRCPCSVHLKCVHLKNANQFLSCPHHRCTKCFKDRASAGGVLFPCQSCPNSFCEDCLPKKGVTFLEKVDRFEKLGFNSTKHNVYIHCHPMCESFAQAEFGYRPPRQRKLSPERLNLKYNFGASFDLEAAQAELEAEKEEVQSKNVHNLRGGRTVKREVTPDKQKSLSAGSGYKVRVQKMCPTSLKILDDYESISEAAKSVGSYGARLINHFSKSPNEAFMGFYWRKGPGSNKTGEPEIITLAAGCTSPISITDSTDGVVTSNAAVASTGATHAASGRAASPISIADSSD